jgi:uncharacterized protein (DUF362 family)/Pyruvate/2-oxoacid:ferredoxin oxidoreductase delta subunit
VENATKKSRVALVRCESYDEAAVLSAVKTGLDLLGGLSFFLKPGEKIVLKPNVLLGYHPDKCVTTHPAVMRAVGKMLQGAGASVLYGDSPSFGSAEMHLKRAQLKQAGDAAGFTLADFDNGVTVSHPGGVLIKQFTVARSVREADGLISLPKLKTHGFQHFTGAVKNQFGCVPGMLKPPYHARLPDPYDFALMLADLNTLLQPRLYVMDGIIGMEGNGPMSGHPIKLNVLLFSQDPVALDATACRIINVDPETVPTSGAGEKAGLGTYRAENIEIVGEALEAFFTPQFEARRTAPLRRRSGPLRNFIKNRISERPVIDQAKCTRCGTCVSMCPLSPKGLNWCGDDHTQPPFFEYDRCIRCFCCQETCPEGAITVRTPPVGKLIRRI